MSELIIRKASSKDIEFLVEAIVEAEKGGTEKFGFASMLNLSESEARSYIKKMLEEEIDGCEFSVSSFLIVNIQKENVAAVGGWIEGINDDNQPSTTIKSNLFSYILPIENIKHMYQNSHVLKGIQHERKWHTLQIEYVYVKPQYRGKHLSEKLICKHIEYATHTHTDLSEVYVQLFEVNIYAKLVYEHLGFLINKISDNTQDHTSEYFPGNIKIEMIKKI